VSDEQQNLENTEQQYADIPADVRKQLLTPTRAAKYMGFPPQYLYNWIKKQNAPHHPDAAGKEYVIIDELIEWRSEHNKTARPGRPKEEAGNLEKVSRKTGIRNGSIVMWPHKPGISVKVAQTLFKIGQKEQKEGNYFLTFYTNIGTAVDFRISTVAEHLDKGEIKIIGVQEILKMCRRQLEINEADPRALALLKDTLDILAQTGYNESRGEEVELTEPPSTDAPEEDDDNDSTVGPEET
jgi:hypothetical protein